MSLTCPEVLHQTRLSVDADMGLHAEVPLVALLAGVHLGVACFVFVLGGDGRCNQGGIDCGSRLQD